VSGLSLRGAQPATYLVIVGARSRGFQCQRCAGHAEAQRAPMRRA
jgi:hypothetical protein